MRILHGENTVQSRQKLFTSISAAQQNQQQVIHLDAKSLDLVALEQTLGERSLFAENQLIIIEELHSLLKSKKKDQLIEMISQFALRAPDDSKQLILWEKRDLTPTMLKKFAGTVTEHFKISSSLFTWLDSLSGQKNPGQIKRSLDLLRQALQKDGDFMCFSMLVRQIRLLIQTKENALGGMAPFMAMKLKKQSGSFSLEQLLTIHHKLLLIDLAQKTSATRLNPTQELELLVTEL